MVRHPSPTCERLRDYIAQRMRSIIQPLMLMEPALGEKPPGGLKDPGCRSALRSSSPPGWPGPGGSEAGCQPSGAWGGIAMADDGIADLPVELLKGVGLSVDRGGSCAGPEGAILHFLNHEKDVLHGALRWHQSGSGGRDAGPVWAKGLGRHTNPQAGLAAAATQ
jgi:hypothetical protein